MQYPASLGNHPVAVGCVNKWRLPVCVCVCVCVCAQSCPNLCDPMDYILPGSSVHGVSQARILQWVAMPSCRGSSWPRNRTQVSSISWLAGGFFITVPPGKSYVFLAWALMDYSFIWLDQKMPFLGLLFKPTLKATSENSRRVFHWYTGHNCNLPHALVSLILFNLKSLGS